ncbi:MAG: glutathione S-transferase N-terminal domain-containing protein [Patescibacteria group bacterium]
MLTLYVMTGCPYCAKVLKAAEELGVTLETKNIDDDGVSDELLERGGKAQTPFLWSADEDVNMYESGAIVDYLHERFGDGKVDSNGVSNPMTCPI